MSSRAAGVSGDVSCLLFLHTDVKGQSTYEFFMQRRDEERGVAKPHPPATKHLPVGKKVSILHEHPMLITLVYNVFSDESCGAY